tara:strand:+ start:305 stop:895 length:591 start_codon:yes stop_codon:yes gene_type:complete
MESKYVDFIGMYSNVLPDGFCQHVIDQFEYKRTSSHWVKNRQDWEGKSKTVKHDEFLFATNLSFAPWNDMDMLDTIGEGLQCCFNDYADTYDVLRDIPIHSDAYKIQKTEPGGGYHVFHAEAMNRDSCDRILVWILYLNDIDEAGETEFLYQKLRVPPKQNSLVIFPANFAYVHRGNVVHGERSKYIVTGWFYHSS